MEGGQSHARRMRSLPCPEAAAHRVWHLRHIREAPGPRRLSLMSPIDALIERLGVDIDPALLERALTHRSYAYEHGGLPTNERLEFLGDSVLGLVVTDSLYRTFPDLPEGQLAKLRAAVVNARALASIGRELGIGPALRLGRGEETTGGRDKSSILADTVEALIGAVYENHGIEVATRIVHRLVDDRVESSASLGAGLDWKTSLQELTATMGLGVPLYVVTEDGPDHAKTFEARVKLGEELFGFGEGHSKKSAEQAAAATAYEELQGREPVVTPDASA